MPRDAAPALSVESPPSRVVARLTGTLFAKSSGMMRLTTFALLALAACTVSTRGVEGPAAPPAGHPDDNVRFEGTVARGDRLPTPQQQLAQVAVILVQGGKDPIQVALAPTWYLEQHGFHLTPDEPLTVTGRTVETDGKPRIIATEVTRGSQTLKLRDETGRPLWEPKPAEE